MIEDLKPCPFCGSEAMCIGEYIPEFDGDGQERCLLKWAVRCDKCGSRAGLAFVAVADAAEAWNRRAVALHVAEPAAAEKDGRFIVLPFNYGDIMYCLYEDDDSGELVVSDDTRFGRLCVECICNDSVDGVVPLDEIGKTVFHAPAEAEAALAARKGGDGK